MDDLSALLMLMDTEVAKKQLIAKLILCYSQNGMHSVTALYIKTNHINRELHQLLNDPSPVHQPLPSVSSVPFMGLVTINNINCQLGTLYYFKLLIRLYNNQISELVYCSLEYI